MPWLTWWKKRDRINASDCWFVELDKQPVAMILNPAGADMFWFTWDVLPFEDTPIPAELWDYSNDARRSFRHVSTGERNTLTFPAGRGILSDGRVLLRGPLRAIK